LECDPITERTEVVSKVNVASRLCTTEDSFGHKSGRQISENTRLMIGLLMIPKTPVYINAIKIR
jgi:hypothetical protein